VADLLAALPVAGAAAVSVDVAGAVAAAVAGAGAIVVHVVAESANLAVDFDHNFADEKENFSQPGALSRICYLGFCDDS
jgi:hypothetical protein